MATISQAVRCQIVALRSVTPFQLVEAAGNQEGKGGVHKRIEHDHDRHQAHHGRWGRK